MTSTVGAFLIAAGGVLFLFDLFRNLRPTFTDNPGNVWNAGTLEWLPTDTFQTRSIPIVTSREPLWDQPGLPEDVEAGRYYLPRTATGRRETIVTSPLDATPQYVLQIPGEPSWRPFHAAVFTAAFFMLLTVKLVLPAIVFGVAGVVAVLWWMWRSDPDPAHPPVDVGGGLILPVTMTGPSSHSWWGTVTLLFVAASVFGCLVFCYFFLWTVNPEMWAGEARPDVFFGLGAATLYALSSGVIWIAGRWLTLRTRFGPWTGVRLALGVAPLVLTAALFAELYGLWDAGLRPTENAYAATVYAFAALNGFYVATLALMGWFALARSLAGLLDGVRRQVYDNTMLLWHYAVAQALVGTIIVQLAPRLLT
jgi:cytochrome c oxidase subunit I+III